MAFFCLKNLLGHLSKCHKIVKKLLKNSRNKDIEKMYKHENKGQSPDGFMYLYCLSKLNGPSWVKCPDESCGRPTLMLLIYCQFSCRAPYLALCISHHVTHWAEQMFLFSSLVCLFVHARPMTKGPFGQCFYFYSFFVVVLIVNLLSALQFTFYNNIVDD